MHQNKEGSKFLSNRFLSLNFGSPRSLVSFTNKIIPYPKALISDWLLERFKDKGMTELLKCALLQGKESLDESQMSTSVQRTLTGFRNLS